MLIEFKLEGSRTVQLYLDDKNKDSKRYDNVTPK